VVSEFGAWGLPNVTALWDHYDGEPHWFTHDYLPAMKRPGDVLGEFEASHAADVFDDHEDLATVWQRRVFQSIETVIADVRAHEGVAGYVITELTDIEWESDGVLDHLLSELVSV